MSVESFNAAVVGYLTSEQQRQKNISAKPHIHLRDDIERQLIYAGSANAERSGKLGHELVAVWQLKNKNGDVTHHVMHSDDHPNSGVLYAKYQTHEMICDQSGMCLPDVGVGRDLFLPSDQRLLPRLGNLVLSPLNLLDLDISRAA